MQDPYLWLEEVEGEKALEWVRSQNEKTLGHLQSHPAFEAIYEKNLEIYNSEDRIANPVIRGDHLYNFWQDAVHERGIWRRTSLESYLQDQPQWEVLLDVDALGEREGVNWVYKGVVFHAPQYKRCLVQLSRGGADATEIREFDVERKAFVKDGFIVPEAKSGVSWKNADAIYLATDFGQGSLTTSGYPRMVRHWKRGTPIEEAELLFEGESSDVGVFNMKLETAEESHDLIIQAINFYEFNFFLIREDGLLEVELPRDARPFLYKNQLVVHLKSDWEAGGVVYPQGALISTEYSLFIEGKRKFTLLYEPDAHSTVESVAATKNLLLVNVLQNVNNQLYEYRLEEGEWKKKKVPMPDLGSITLVSTALRSDLYFLSFQSFLQPTTLYVVKNGGGEPEPVRSLPAFFDAAPYEVHQYEARSKDGTPVPYFLVQEIGRERNGETPTLLYGYGGFEVSQTPTYPATIGANWLSRGGAYVVANIRGGGEFGPRWHRAALKENRQRAFDDFIAVAEELIDQKVTSPKHLGIMGGSNGGLLVGAVFTQRPDLFNAVACLVPLLDMQRYHKLLAGASWMGEYGNPELPEEWAYIEKYSPYHNLSPQSTYPKVLFATSTRDDRVHPGHARKMARRMLEMGKEVYLYENIEGGHAGAATNKQRAFMFAVVFTYLLDRLQDSTQ